MCVCVCVVKGNRKVDFETRKGVNVIILFVNKSVTKIAEVIILLPL